MVAAAELCHCCCLLPKLDVKRKWLLVKRPSVYVIALDWLLAIINWHVPVNDAL